MEARAEHGKLVHHVAVERNESIYWFVRHWLIVDHSEVLKNSSGRLDENTPNKPLNLCGANIVPQLIGLCVAEFGELREKWAENFGGEKAKLRVERGQLIAAHARRRLFEQPIQFVQTLERLCKFYAQLCKCVGGQLKRRWNIGASTKQSGGIVEITFKICLPRVIDKID